MSRLWRIRQSKDNLPPYIPRIDNGYGRSGLLPSPFVALTTFDVVSPDKETCFSGPGDVRKHFRVMPDTRILLLSIDRDNRLEQYWKWSVARRFAEYLSTLDVVHITAPNFSFPLDVPRPEHLINRMRSLKSAEQLSAAGLSVIPHLNAFNQKDWDGWRDFLRDHPHIILVAQEFQTGLASRLRASWHIWQMRNIEQSLGRGLHLIAVGGRRHLPLLIGLSGVTVVDSMPFMRALMRRLLGNVDGKWVENLTPPGEALDDLLARNVIAYSNGVQSTIRALRRLGPLIPEPKAIAPENSFALDHAALPVSDMQLPLWPAAAGSSRTTPTPLDLGTKTARVEL
jgi:hypothetical protein